MLRDDYLSVLEASSKDELRAQLARFSCNLGFERFGLTAVVERFGGDPWFVSLNNMPEGYAALGDSPSRASVDPVVQHCKQSSVPLAWGQQIYVDQGLGASWEDQAQFGYAHGIALALHMPRGWHLLLGVDRKEALPEGAIDLTRVVADFQLFAVHATQAVERLIVTDLVASPGRPALTGRELECLRWTMEGKTAWEVGAILGISERTAVLHVNNATHKLACVSKHQAVIKAIRLGLIH
jgi:DNA-binding CsgD family transcriptional regulator